MRRPSRFAPAACADVQRLIRTVADTCAKRHGAPSRANRRTSMPAGRFDRNSGINHTGPGFGWIAGGLHARANEERSKDFEERAEESADLHRRLSPGNPQ